MQSITKRSACLPARALRSRGAVRIPAAQRSLQTDHHHVLESRQFRRKYQGSRMADGPVQLSYTLKEIDKLLTSVAEQSSKTSLHPSPLALRTFQVPWLSSSTPNLASDAASSSASATSPSSPQSATQHVVSPDELAKLNAPKHMSESYTSFDLPLKSDPELFQRYVNQQGGFRMGKLLEHLDSLAGAVAYRHCLPAPSAPTVQDAQEQSQAKSATAAFHQASSRAGLYLATASADRLDMLGRLTRDNVRDLRFSGFVTWTGSSSMEVVVKMQAVITPTDAGAAAEPSKEEGQGETLMLGRFVMVCRDSQTHKARQVPPLLVETSEEKSLWDIGEEYMRRRKASSRLSLDKVPPSQAEAAHLHELMLSVTDKSVEQIDGETVVPMHDTEIESVQLMFPQDRNLHGKVFGGFLMRLAFELCFTNAAIFASEPMRFLSLDQITFRLPVPIGAVLRLSSKVVKTTKPSADGNEPAKAHILVRAEVEEVETGVRRETNTFYFTMAKEDADPIGKTVVPSTYNEAMSYLEGERRLALGDEMRRLYDATW